MSSAPSTLGFLLPGETEGSLPHLTDRHTHAQTPTPDKHTQNQSCFLAENLWQVTHPHRMPVPFAEHLLGLGCAEPVP